MNFKLGKLPPVHDYRTLRLADYVDYSALPPVPSQTNWRNKVKNWPMYMNDQIGDCGPAGIAHEIMLWTANSDKLVQPSDRDVLKAYSEISGYIPGVEETDVGVNILQMLRYCQKVGLGGHKIGPYVRVDLKDHIQTKLGIHLFGGLGIGLNLPKTAQGQQIWDNPSGNTRGQWAPGSWGGHYVNLIDFDGNYYYCVTWGAVKLITPRYMDIYCDEQWTILSEDWFKNGKAPNGFDVNTLYQDLKDISSDHPIGPIPNIPVPVTPPVPPNPPPVPRPTQGNSITISGRTDYLSVEGWRCQKIDD